MYVVQLIGCLVLTYEVRHVVICIGVDQECPIYAPQARCGPQSRLYWPEARFYYAFHMYCSVCFEFANMHSTFSVSPGFWVISVFGLQ